MVKTTDMVKTIDMVRSDYKYSKGRPQTGQDHRHRQEWLLVIQNTPREAREIGKVLHPKTKVNVIYSSPYS